MGSKTAYSKAIVFLCHGDGWSGKEWWQWPGSEPAQALRAVGPHPTIPCTNPILTELHLVEVATGVTAEDLSLVGALTHSQALGQVVARAS